MITKVKSQLLSTSFDGQNEWVHNNTFDDLTVRKPPSQLLKWIGNKQRYARIIADTFPKKYNRYFEPFVGAGAVLGAMSPREGIAGDVLKPLIDMWILVQRDPKKLYIHYKTKWESYINNRKGVYVETLKNFNNNQNPLDFVFLSRTCYGGVVRFTKLGKMSTPLGPHNAIPPESFKERLILWRDRIKNTTFYNSSFEETMKMVDKGDVVYCDPPYVDSQAILYGAQAFRIEKLYKEIKKCKSRGAKIALSIDGHKKSGSKIVDLNIPTGIFEREVLISGGSSMLKRFQKKDEIMIGEDIKERLLLTW